MIGVAKIAFASGATPAPEYGAFISPGSPFERGASRGSYTSPFFTANVTGGVGPFEYEWDASAGITVNTPTANRTTFTTSGFNEEVPGTLSVTVTDTGSSDAETSDTISIAIFFGTQP